MQNLLVARTGPTTGIIAASDGFLLAVVPVTLDEADEEGAVDVADLDVALRLSDMRCFGTTNAYKGKIGMTAVALTVGEVVMPRRQELEAPDYAKLMARWPQPSSKTIDALQLNMVLLAKVGRLFGDGKIAHLRIRPLGGTTDGLLLQQTITDDGAEWLGYKLPWAVLMPVVG